MTKPSAHRILLAALLAAWPLHHGHAAVMPHLQTPDGKESVTAVPGQLLTIQTVFTSETAGDRIGGVHYRLIIPVEPGQDAWQITERGYARHGWEENDDLWDLTNPRPGRDTFPVAVTPGLVPETADTDVIFSTVRADLVPAEAPGSCVGETLNVRLPADLVPGTYSLRLADVEAATVHGAPLSVAGPSSFAILVQPADFELDLLPGWNLLSLPFDLPGNNSLEIALSDEQDCPLFSPLWIWDAENQRYAGITADYQANTGFWAYMPDQGGSGRTIQVESPGGGNAGDPALHHGWNLLAPAREIQAEDLAAPLVVVGPCWHWDAARHTYLPNPSTDLLSPDRVYWIFVASERL